MEEVDSIILQTLHQLGMTFPEDVNTLNELPENFVILSAKKCLDIIVGIEGETDVPEETSQKIVVANELIMHCKKLGYKGKLGYELLLYPNETDTRKILTFLINKLPKETEKAYLFIRDDFSLLIQNICQKVSEELNLPWTPRYSRVKSFNVTSDGAWTKSGCSHVDPFDKIPFRVSQTNDNLTEAFKDYWEKNVPNRTVYTSTDIDSSEVDTQASVIIEKLKHSKINDLSGENIFMKVKKSLKIDLDFLHDKVSAQENTPLSLKDVARSLDEIERESKLLIKQIDATKIKKELVSSELAAEISKETLMKDKIQTLSLVTSLLPDVETNMEKLQLIQEKETNKLVALKTEMAAFEIKRQKENEVIEKHKIKHSKYFKTIRTLEGRVKKLNDEHNKQTNLKLQLRQDCDKRNLRKKYIKKRSAYTKRIMEIIGNISKQKLEINKILSDTRILQKEMNNMNGRLDRSFTVVDELVFKDAKRDEHARKTYKLIAYIHTGCGEIVTKVNEIGSNLREIRDLEKHIEIEKKKNITENLQRVYLDLKYVQSKKKHSHENNDPDRQNNH